MDMTEHANKIKQMEQAGQDTAGELEKLYFDNLAFVRQIGRPFEGRQEVDDLLQEGFCALCKAIAYYDPNKGAGFSYVWGVHLKTAFARMNDSRPYIPYHVRDDMRKYKKLEREYIKAHGEEPPAEYFRDHFTARELEAVNAALLQEYISYLDEPQTEDGGTIGDTIPDTGNSVEDAAIDMVTAAQLRQIWEDVEQVTTPEQAAALKAVYIDGQGTTASPEISKRYRSGLSILQKNRDRFTLYLELIKDDFAYSEGVKYCGASAFHNDGQSATERAALRMIEREEFLKREAARLMEEMQSPLFWDFKYQREQRKQRQERFKRYKEDHAKK